MYHQFVHLSLLNVFKSFYLCLQMQASLLVLCIFDVKGLFRSLTLCNSSCTICVTDMNYASNHATCWDVHYNILKHSDLSQMLKWKKKCGPIRNPPQQKIVFYIIHLFSMYFLFTGSPPTLPHPPVTGRHHVWVHVSSQAAYKWCPRLLPVISGFDSLSSHSLRCGNVKLHCAIFILL